MRLVGASRCKALAGQGDGVTTQEAMELIRDAVPAGRDASRDRLWADLGSGSGTFTFALAEILGDGAEVVAVDREAAALESLRRRLEVTAPAAAVLAATGDFRDPSTIVALQGRSVHGALFANALHFDPDPGATLRAWADRLRPGGRLVVVEYEDRPPNPWVPHPLPAAGLREVAADRGLAVPEVVGERSSSYGGVLYCAWLTPG